MLACCWNHWVWSARMNVLLVTTFLLIAAPALAEDPPKVEKKEVKPDGSPLRKARVQFLTDAVKHFHVAVGEMSVEAKLTPEPALVWDNPVSGTKIGILAVFARNGRPDVMAQFSFTSPQNVVNEFHNLCGDKLVMSRGTQPIWTPSETSTKWQTLDTPEKPAATPQLRLIQMRRLVSTFTVEDDFGWEKTERHQLRLLTTPVHRYGNADDEVIDGAVFVYAMATDPEAVLMLECAKGDSGLYWRYGFGPMSIYALTAKLNGDVVWKISERKEFGQTKSVQYVLPYQLGSGEKYPE